jgi:Flavodoxin
MKAVVVYESMYGNTHLVADAIGQGLSALYDVDVVPIDRVDPRLLDGADLIVVGGPTHAHGMSRSSTREAAVEQARKPDSDLTLDSDAEGPGLRDWFDSLPRLTGRAAAFDTRVDMPAVLTGRASKGIHRRLRQHGLQLAAEPESFLVTKDNDLKPGEADRAREWGEQLTRQQLAPDGASSAHHT